MFAANIVAFLGFFREFSANLYIYSWIAHIFVIATTVYYFSRQNTSASARLIIGIASVSFVCLSFGAPEVLAAAFGAVGVTLILWELLGIQRQKLR
jgi:hypothetical protein